MQDLPNGGTLATPLVHVHLKISLHVILIVPSQTRIDESDVFLELSSRRLSKLSVDNL